MVQVNSVRVCGFDNILYKVKMDTEELFFYIEIELFLVYIEVGPLHFRFPKIPSHP